MVKLKFDKIFTTAHTGKMAGMVSFSTTSAKNSFCKAMKKTPGCICEHCYTEKGFLKTVVNSEKLINNYKLVTTQTVDWQKITGIEQLENTKYIRLEAFGELENELQLKNYLNLAKLFKKSNFTLWTKRTDLIKKVFEKEKKPKNFQLIVSSRKLNVPEDISEIKHVVDKVFTVYTKDEVASENVVINCGSKACLTCKLCYTKNKVLEINELLK